VAVLITMPLIVDYFSRCLSDQMTVTSTAKYVQRTQIQFHSLPMCFPFKIHVLTFPPVVMSKCECECSGVHHYAPHPNKRCNELDHAAQQPLKTQPDQHSKAFPKTQKLRRSLFVDFHNLLSLKFSLAFLLCEVAMAERSALVVGGCHRH
jgi:hypothetical protein